MKIFLKENSPAVALVLFYLLLHCTWSVLCDKPAESTPVAGNGVAVAVWV